MKSSFFARHHMMILMGLVFLLPLMLAGTRRAMMSNHNDIKEWLPEGYEETTTFEWYRNIFPSDMFVLASWEGCTLDSTALELFVQKLVPPVEEDWRPGKAKARFFAKAITGKQLVDQLVEKQGLTREQAIDRLRGIVIGRDGNQTCAIVSVDQNSEALWESYRKRAAPTLIDKLLGRRSELFREAESLGINPEKKFLHALVEHVYQVAETQCAIPRDKLHLGGPPVDNVSIDQEGEKSLMRLAGVSAIVGLLMSWWCLRSWSLTGMVFSSAIFTAGLAMFAVALSGVSMNAIMLSMPSLVYVAAASGAIHLANYYRDTVRQHGFENAPDTTAKQAWLPLALASGTTGIGLLSMCITDLMPIRMFGLFSAIGVMISFFVVIFYMPSLLHLMPLKNIAAPRDTRFDPGLSPRWRHVGNFIIRHNMPVAAVCILLMIVGGYGVLKTETSVKLMRLFSPNARIIKDYAWLEDKLGPLVPMEVVIRVDRERCKLDTFERMVLVSHVQRAIMQLPDVGSTLAAPTFAPNMPKKPSLLERRTWITQLEKHRGELRDYVYADGNEELWRVSARVAALNDLDYGTFVADIRAAVEPVVEAYREKGVEGLETVYTGLVPLIYKAQSSMLNGLALNFVGDLILIGVAIICLLRRAIAGLLLILPCLFPLAIVFGFMGWTGIVVDVGTVMVPAVALGVTVDDAIHFMLWCRHGEERGMSRSEAIMFAYEDCARAIYQSWGVIGLGLAAFALSTFTPTQRFGYLMFTMLTVSSIGNLVLLPALLASPLARRFWKNASDPAKAETATVVEQAGEPDHLATSEIPVFLPVAAEAGLPLENELSPAARTTSSLDDDRSADDTALPEDDDATIPITLRHDGPSALPGTHIRTQRRRTVS